MFTACAQSTTHAPAKAPVAAPSDLAKIEATTGGRLGVFALDTATDEQLAHRADERFAMCSTFKWVLTAALLARVDRGEVALDERVSYGHQDLLEYAPVTTAAVAEGSMTVEALAAAAVVTSDNTAANLLLAKVGGPAGLTRFMRSCGDSVTRLDRLEPDLNANVPGDPRDTTSPRAMAGLMRHILCGEDTLSPTSRERLLRWLRECETGKNRLRAGFPSDWLVGDKTGSCQRNAVNDVAIAVPPGRAPVIVAVYTSNGSAEFAALEAAHAAVARVVAREL
ncbi:MAG TPA: class A beta-lactamase [Polyangiaceae bacterium]|nr:class A beta-lactamase [Polyangiaceae bacterium]